MRPKRLSSNRSTAYDVAFHAVNWYETKVQKVDALLLLLPTQPFRRLKTLNKGINIFNKHKYSSIVGVEQCRHNSDNMFRSTKKKYKSLKKLLRKTENIYRANGSYFLSSPSKFRKNKSFFNNNTYPLVCKSKVESIDVDTKEDWDIAKKFINFKFD